MHPAAQASELRTTQAHGNTSTLGTQSQLGYASAVCNVCANSAAAAQMKFFREFSRIYHKVKLCARIPSPERGSINLFKAITALSEQSIHPHWLYRANPIPEA
jgi:hypothetical protein